MRVMLTHLFIVVVNWYCMQALQGLRYIIVKVNKH